jgi:type 2 lantibiotic biosynthesis protein LanM
LLATQAIWDLERSLLAQLVHLSTPSFFAEFSATRPAGHHLLALLIGELPGERKNLYYQAFVQQQLSDGLSGFFKKYPVLARLTATTIAFWVAATAEFLQRLKTDWRELQQTFAFEGQPGVTEAVPNKAQSTKVGALDLTLSDPHHCGRTVIIVQFETGAKLVYKPKDLGLDAAFVEFLHWCNARGAALTLRAPQVLCRDGYGWAEFIEQLPCQNETAVRNFYHRAGMLLCLLYVLGGTDCHHENLIAHGDQLILIDMEALLHHNVKPLDESAIVGVDEVDLERQFWDSVLRTGLLPRWDFGKDNQVAYDVSGLGSLSPQPAPWRTAQWKAVNTDDMHLAQEAAMLPVSANVPIFNGQCPAPNDYLEYIVAGFQQMYTFLEHHAAAILSPDGPFTRFAHERVRFGFRPTRVYGAILQRSLAPELVQDGVKRSLVKRGVRSPQNRD